MARSGSSLPSVAGRAPPRSVADDCPRVVRLHGDYDGGAVAELSGLLSSAIALDDADLVLDITEVGFVDAAVIGVIVRARSFLQLRSRSLTLRRPSRSTRAVLGICDLDVLVELSSTRADSGNLVCRRGRS